ncbi:hypothetical protein F0L68_40430, partial [Solihabitans fulvus]
MDPDRRGSQAPVLAGQPAPVAPPRPSIVEPDLVAAPGQDPFASELLAAISQEQVRAYLRAHGWTEEASNLHPASLWTHQHPEGDPRFRFVELPAATDRRWGARLADVADVVADVEQRPTISEQVLHDVAGPDSPTRFRTQADLEAITGGQVLAYLARQGWQQVDTRDRYSLWGHPRHAASDQVLVPARERDRDWARRLDELAATVGLAEGRLSGAHQVLRDLTTQPVPDQAGDHVLTASAPAAAEEPAAPAQRQDLATPPAAPDWDELVRRVMSGALSPTRAAREYLAADQDATEQDVNSTAYQVHRAVEQERDRLLGEHKTAWQDRVGELVRSGVSTAAAEGTALAEILTDPPTAPPVVDETAAEPVSETAEPAIPTAAADPARGPAPRYRPASQDGLAPSGEIARLRANLAALRTLRALQQQQRPATAEEQAVLARWSGWGAVARVFDETDARLDWARAELRELMTEAEVRAAARNTINAHYTDLALVRGIWQAATALGFDGGRVLEPGCGSGNFLAVAPESAHLVGVELDPTSAAIAAALYPDAQILTESFAATRAPEGAFGLVVGNVPFGDITLTDRRHNQAGHAIHNHFLIKSLHLTAPGGLLLAVTSRYTLDAQNPAARRELVGLADLVGAVRLPSGAHQRAAGTRAVTDVLVLRRREPGRAPAAGEWEHAVRTNVDGVDLPVSEYFLAHPEMVLGQLRSGESGNAMYRADDLAVHHPDLAAVPADLAAALGRVVEHARAENLLYSPAAEAATRSAGPVALVGGVAARREGYITARDNGSFQRVEDGQQTPYEVPNRQASELRALLGIRDAVVALLETEAATGEDTPELDRLRQRLNTRYDAYLDRYGPINRFTWRHTGRIDPDTGEEKMSRVRPPVWAKVRVDPFAPALAALENFDPSTQRAAKADVFTVRVIAPRQPRLGADTPADAVAICLDTHGGVVLAEIARLLGTDEADARHQLGTLVFDDPDTGALVAAADYLSGTVRATLRALLDAGVDEDSPYWVNVVALREVIPPDLEPEQIAAKLGAAWIDALDVQQFLQEILQDTTVRVDHPGASVWAVRGNNHGVAATQVWGTEFAPAIRIAQNLLEQRPVLVYDVYDLGGGKTKRVLNQDKTVEAQGKADAMAERFSEWAWENPARAQRLAGTYNELFNGIRLRSYDEVELSLPGLAVSFSPRPHQVAAVARMINEPSVLLAHEVGAGKTAEMVMGVMEMRRLTLVAKPAVVVPNNMLEQFGREWLQLYPQAKLLVATKEDFAGERRRE